MQDFCGEKMKHLTLLAILIALSTDVMATEAVATDPMCDVKVCNRISRFSLDIWSHVKDSMGETCFDIQMPKSQAVVGKELSSESRWYQGSSINPTKKSVTKIKEVGVCR
jgi:hypothetical protein